MTERGIRPFPMIYGDRDRTLPLGDAPASLERRALAEFQRWAVRRYTVVDFADYDVSVRDRRTEPRRRCRHCSRALPAGARSDARFCSPSCRSTHFRRHALPQRARNKCQSCRKPIPRQARADACYCSSACRQLAYQARPAKRPRGF
jgi:predicted nucleic acid-binding Zn ribbon protein